MRFTDTRLAPTWEKATAGERLSREDGLTLFEVLTTSRAALEDLEQAYGQHARTNSEAQQRRPDRTL